MAQPQSTLVPALEVVLKDGGRRAHRLDLPPRLMVMIIRVPTANPGALILCDVASLRSFRFCRSKDLATRPIDES